jgi:hypothetical protein
MTRLADAAQSAVETAVQQLAATWCLATVTAAHTDGTVDITTATGPLASVRRLKAYSSPAVNDVVVVLTHPNGNWVVLGALATS